MNGTTKNSSSVKATIFAVGMGTFMSALDSSIVNLAMPMIRQGFGISLSMVEWVVAAYLLVVSSLLLTFGRMSDLYGHKRLYMTGFFIFLLGSLFCGLSVHIGMLIGSRIIQALGAGMLFSTGPAIITNAVPPWSRGKALSITAIAVALGLSAGPVLGGVLTTYLGWQSIFFINLPIGAAGIVLVYRFIPKDGEQKSAPFDFMGSAMVFAALLLILLPLNLSGDYHIPLPLFLSLLGAGILLILFFIYYESRQKHPMLDIGLFRNRVFSASNAAAMFAYMAQSIMVFLVPFYLQNLRGYSAFASGLLYLPLPIATMCIAPISGTFSDRHDSRYLSAAGSLILAVGLFLLGFMNVHTSNLYIIVSMIVTGLGFGMFQTPNNSAIMGNVPPQNRGTASGTLATMRNIGMVLGVACSGALFSLMEKTGETLYTGKGLTGTALTNSTFVYAMQFTLRAAVLVALLSMTASLFKGKVQTEKEKQTAVYLIENSAE